MDCNSPSIKTNKARIFISYSHRGNGPKWKAALVNALQVFERHHLLDVWEDGKIRVSSFWDDDIKQAMRNARLAVVLLTKEALESEYIINKEFPFLRERQQRDKLPVFPVVCEACNWKDYDWLRATQAPNESNPLSQLSEAAQDRVFRKLATDIAEELSRSSLAELPKPDQSLPPDHVYLNKFPLTRGSSQSEKLIGREQELTLLDLAFSQPHTSVVSLVAWGGVGKTMLVQHWLQRLQHEGWFGVRRVYAWSFYSQGIKEDRQASEDAFLAHALEWFGVQCEPTLSPWDKGKILADAVARERTLLILDGIEPLQYPPGPMGGQLRSPGVQSLLKQLARKATAIQNPQSEIGGGLCLVTTRETLTDLANFERRPDSAWGSMLRVDLGNLKEEAGAALLHHAGAKRAGAAEIKADDTELLAASSEADGHALTLNLLGRFLARAHGGDIRRRDLVKFEEADRNEQGGTTFKMLVAFENWFARSGEFGARQLAILRILGLFDRPADAGCIGVLRKPPVITGLTDPLFIEKKSFLGFLRTLEPLGEEDWNNATSFLADFGLLSIQTNTDKSESLLDCHPLIREYFGRPQQKEKEKAWRFAHRRLYKHLKHSTEYQPETLDGLQPLYQAVVHGCQARMYKDTLKVLVARIRRSSDEYSWRRLGAFSADLGALSCFFEEPWIRLVPGLSTNYEVILLAETSFALRSVGRLVEGRVLMRECLAKYHSKKIWQAAARVASNLSELELTLGDVITAVCDAEQAIQYAERANSRFERMLTRTTLADALHQTGRLTEALERFVEAEAIESKAFPRTPLLRSLWGFRYCDLLLAKSECAVWQDCMGRMLLPDPIKDVGAHGAPRQEVERCREVEQRAAHTLEWDTRYGALLDFGLHRLMLGRAVLYRSILEHSSFEERNSVLHSQIDAAIGSLLHAGFQYILPIGLLTRSWLRVLEGNLAGARADLDEAWDIAERGPMRLHMTDIHLYRARLFFREKAYPWKSPQDDLAAAEKLINECGYHRRDEELADAKRTILGG